MKLGLEKKEERWKLWALGGLVVVGGWLMYTNLAPDSGSSGSPAPAARVAAPMATPTPDAAPPEPVVRRKANGRVAGEFRPKLRDARPENRPQLDKIDPTIHLTLLARVQNAAMEGGARNIFQFGAAAPAAPTTPIPTVPKIIPGPLKVAGNNPPAQTGPPPPPMAPPIPFKYYGYSSVKGEPRKRAFFLDGEDVIVAWEGDLIKNRYRVLRVGLRSVEMEDTQFKDAKQALPLAEDLAG